MLPAAAAVAQGGRSIKSGKVHVKESKLEKETNNEEFKNRGEEQGAGSLVIDGLRGELQVGVVDAFDLSGSLGRQTVQLFQQTVHIFDSQST